MVAVAPPPPAPLTRLVALDRDECVRLLASAQVGRVAAAVPAGAPLIRPVVYCFDEASQSVLFRCAEGSKLAALLRSERVAFEVDGVDPVDQLGWSVIVTGRAEELHGPWELAHAERAAPRSWAPGVAAHLMRIRATVVSGRRLTRER